MTDHKILRCLLDQWITTPEQHKWIVKLLGFDYEILYRPGKSNNVADALSRRDSAGNNEDELLQDEEELGLVTSPSSEIWSEIEQAAKNDAEMVAARAKIESEPTAMDGIRIRRGLLIIQDRVWVPNDQLLKTKILSEFHSSLSAGHSGELRTYHRLAQVFWWEGVRGDVRKFVRECDVCQSNKADLRKPAALLEPRPIPDAIWTDISMDFIEGLPHSGGKDAIFVVVYAHFISLAHPFSAKDVAGEFVKGVAKLHGTPVSIVSDRDRVFLSLFWKELFRL